MAGSENQRQSLDMLTFFARGSLVSALLALPLLGMRAKAGHAAADRRGII